MSDHLNLHELLSEEDLEVFCRYVGSPYTPPDVTIAPDGSPYLYRWHVVPRNPDANVYLHIQVASDPERPLHDHPWDNTSHILSGGYDEIVLPGTPFAIRQVFRRFKGQTIHRRAEEAHRLILPSGVPYTMTLFTTGKHERTWGFWCNDHRGRPVWVPHTDCIVFDEDGRSVFREPENLSVYDPENAA